MPDNDQNISDFFEQLKHEEAKTEVPGMEELLPKKPVYKRIVFWYSGIAASIAVILFFWLNYNSANTENKSAAIRIDIEVESENATGSLVEQKGDLESWESPTDYLLTSF